MARRDRGTSPPENPIHLILLILWCAIALIVRLIDLDAKPIWSDEFATLAFSLGRGFHQIPLDVPIAPELLLHPLEVDPSLGVAAVPERLFAESNHPPVYFMLTHLWVDGLAPAGELVPIGIARSLSVLFGVATVPALFGLAGLSFRSRIVAQIAAALMAVSPFGVYLAQEARHYTLAILLAIASLACLSAGIRRLNRQMSLPPWLVIVGVGINTLGVAVHFFFAFLLLAEGAMVLGLWIRDLRRSPLQFPAFKTWKGFYFVALGTAAGGLVWLPIFLQISGGDSELTAWASPGDPMEILIQPIARIVAWLTTMVVLLPVENQSLPVIIISGIVTFFILGILGKVWVDGWRVLPPSRRESVQLWGGLTLVVLVLFLAIAWGFGIDLTLAARYQFIYFPAILLIVAAGLAAGWQNPGKYDGRRWAIALILTVSFFSGLMVAHNFAYQKPDRPEWVARAIASHSNPEIPTLIATVHKSHEQTGEMMGIAWELQKFGMPELSPFFLLAHKYEKEGLTATATLDRTLKKWPRPLNLWTVNFSAHFDPSLYNCQLEPGTKSYVPGYYFQMYRCGETPLGN
ncbi:hypothetical protein [Lyngbya sp. CCY1209]|uniref:glycosyltransferase family 39 protein n=1 Tax=Lyngbya sp. CCY1209 TaxID=2886103 RepID=UPI002D20F895|nr:hypothetical protein [Lyngbya sp. CCY1209]MEB3885929.1 hypothetical protein [Lyngbya sp. CCY1209]